MARINVYEEAGLAGWFNPETATCYNQGKEWDGNNMVGVITRSQWVDEYLYRTAGGRWVLNHDASRYHNGSDDYRFLTDDEARDWLLRSEINDKAIEEHFGELEEERGPGRPEIGPPVNIRLGDLLPKIDARANAEGVTRAELVRRLVAAAL